MSSQKRLRIRTFLMVFALVVGSNIGDLLLKRGMTQVGEVELTSAGIARAFPLAMTNPQIWLGVLFLMGCTAGFMTMLSWADYSYVMPVGAFGYAMLTLLAVIFLHEQVSLQRWTGVILICLGVLLVGRTTPRTTPVKEVVE